MMVRHLLGLVLASCALRTVAGQRQTIAVGDTRYLVSAASPYSARLGWVLAYQFCRSQGMELLTQDTQEQAVLLDQYLGTNGYDGETFWTSGNRMGSNQWLWMTTGQPYNSTFSYWNPDPPASGDNTSCMAYQAGKWFPSECTNPRHYICQLTRCFYYTSSDSSRPSTAAGEGGLGGRGGTNNINAAASTSDPSSSSSSTSPLPPPSSTVPGIRSSVSIITGQHRPFRTGSPGAGGTRRPAVEPLLRDTIRALTSLTTLERASTTTSTPKAGTSQNNQNSRNNQNNSADKGTSSAISKIIIHFPHEIPITTLSPPFQFFTTKGPTPQRRTTMNNRIIHFPGEEVPVTTLQTSGQEERVMTVTQEPHVGPMNATEAENVVRSEKVTPEVLVNDDETITEDDERINEIEGRPVPVLSRLLAPPEPPRTHSDIIGSNVNSEEGRSDIIVAASSTNEGTFPELTNAQASKMTEPDREERGNSSIGVIAGQETPTEITLSIVGKDGDDSFLVSTELPDQGQRANKPLDVSTTDERKSGTDGAVGGEDDRGGRGKKLGVRASAETWQLERKETSSWPTVARRGS